MTQISNDPALSPTRARQGGPLRGIGILDGSSKNRVIVIGGGFGGLASAIRLQAAGHGVTLVEARE
ncbi:MAG: FAD-dependent oxidoreductase, partial [Chloroflexota bacterium]|nr:FAD-dependent oxidoreductase [Chloroflexota bacterium]